MNKKGLSPLATTVILLAISIIIGILIMSWGKGYVEQATARADQKAVQEKQASIFQDIDSRLANGEITKEQYDSIKATLMK